ncbi:MAG: bifunctional UDP-N-acetylglucosamine diphosphorylase/glucosamine-1-phosphate N-acetyltransferase GlmU [Chloroflexi bacterium]|nr:bifunctional UDP-N-acetylglucosamine diphosphorylase/glucosamine-1-phosphate N-acetyltransferase GlmU [Chloroflexota bacterium]
MNIAVVILAAGQGKRMHTRRAKVLHPVAGMPMILHVLRATATLDPSHTVVVVGYQADEVRQQISYRVTDGVVDTPAFVEQAQPLGTGHAIMQAASVLEGKADVVVVVYGDGPLLRAETLRHLVALHTQTRPVLTLATCEMANPAGYGRIVRDSAGRLQQIVEEVAATDQQRKIREINPGLYCFDAAWLWSNLEKIPLSAKGEYYLTDLVEIAVAQGNAVEILAGQNPLELLGVNSQAQLAEAEQVMRQRINLQHMEAGVTLIDPATTYIDTLAQIGADTVIYPNTYLQGRTVIGEACVIGPGAVIRDATLGNGVAVFNSVVEESLVEDGVDIGPYSHLRPGNRIGVGVHIGNYAELKSSRVGAGTKMGHVSYLGDATVGEGVNIGAGTITCNYDGKRKNKTVIESKAFIGSDTMLVAPVKVGARARTGAGSVVTRDIPADSLAFGVPARVRDTSSRIEVPGTEVPGTETSGMDDAEAQTPAKKRSK